MSGPPARTGSRRPSAGSVEAALLFVLFFTAYFLIGYRVVVEEHVVNFDALARLSHAYFVWHNDPPKLAAIGFVWPPIQTIAFLPFSLVKPLATSLAALPATSATFGAAMIVALNAVMRLVEMPRWARWPLLIAFGLNPMIVYYAANGMSEVVYLSFLVAGVYFLLRWYLHRGSHLLALVGIFLGLATLARYEMLPFAVIVGVAVALILLLDRRHTRDELEGSLLLYTAPIAYLVASWLFFSWLIVGDPLHFFNFGPVSADISTSQGELASLDLRGTPATTIAKYLLLLNVGLFPLAVIAAPALLGGAAARRDSMAVVLAMLVLANAVVTGVLFWRGQDPNLFQLRYNIRAMPLALIGAAWLFYLWRRSRARYAIWGLTLAVLVLSLPLTWRTMETYTYQYEENVFLTALSTGRDQEGTIAVGGYPIGIESEQAMADYIGELDEDAQVLADDAQALGVMLLTGRPDRFVDRIDKGDDRWEEIRDAPRGEVEYLLVATADRCRPPCEDLVRERYPRILADREPGLRVVFRTRRYVLAAVEP